MTELAARPSSRLARLAAVLPAGTASVGGGLLVLGVSSYVFLTLAARSLTPARFADVSILYVLVYTAGPGVFLPVEQELGRALAERSARGVGGGPVVRRATLLSAALTAVIVVAGLAGGPAVVPHLFGGSWALLVELLVATAALWAAHVTRGGLAGLNRFGRYGAQLGLEGGSRIVGVALLAGLGVHAVGWWGALLGGGLLVSVLATGPAVRPMLAPGPPASWRELSGALGWLLVASLLAQVLVNAGPVAARLVSSASERASAGQLLTGLVLARLPLFAFAAVQAALLPRLAAQIAAGEGAEFLRGLARLTTVTAAVGAATTVVAAAAGRPLLHLFFGHRYDLGSGLLAELAAASGLYMLAVIAAQTLVALRRYSAAAGGWAVGVAVFAVTVALGSHVVPRVAHAFLLGAAASLAVFGALMSRAVSHWLTLADARS